MAFALLMGIALTLLVGERKSPVNVVSRDPSQLSEVDSALILNRIREGDLVAIKGDLEGAKAEWKKAREKGAGYWPIHEAIGDSLARHALDTEADEEFETAIRIAGQQLGRAPATLCLKRAGALLRLKRPEPALRLLIECGTPDKLASAIIRIVRETPALLDIVKEAARTRDPRLWAIVAAEAPDPADKASALGKYARGVAPDNTELATRAIQALRECKRLDEAIEVATAWVKAAPSSPDAYETWGRLLAETGDRDRARLILSTIVDVKPGDAGAHLRLGAALRDLDDFAGAIAQFEEAERLRPEDSIAAAEIGLTQVSQGNFEAAAAAFSKISKGGGSEDLRRRLPLEVQPRIDAARRAGNLEAVAKLRRWCGELGIVEAGLFDIKIVMTWDAHSDVDLDVTDPKGETVNHGHRQSASGAIYPFDNTQGRGPEHYVLHKAPKGKYRVGVHLHGQTTSKVKIEIILFEDTPRERRLSAHAELGGKKTEAWPIEFDVP
ncbi:MAG TPA: hypothetical protein VFS19_00450 [Planctomycetota bacterium]|nr:hypothetical protein [Planctomycetota bacterium]